jgi:regulator of replication initiation timing
VNKHYTLQEYIEKFSSIQDSYDYYFELQKQNDELRNRINDLLVDDTEYKLENERLNNIIDKAIEYTKQFTNGKTSSIDEWKNVELVLENILEILKGEK